MTAVPASAKQMKVPLFSKLLLTLATSFIALAVVRASGADAAGSPNHLSLARAFPATKLQEILLPREQWPPFPTLKEREGWRALPEPVAKRLLTLREESLNKPVPALPATLYLGYARTGNRSDFERVFFERRVMLQNLILAECIEGRFLDAVANALWTICEESTCAVG